MALSLSGDFHETPFSDVVAVLRLQKATGTLTCSAKGLDRSVFVKNGQIIFATSQDEKDRLGETLVRTGKITRAQLTKALEAHRKYAGLKKIGAIFVEHRLVTPKDLFHGLKVQVRNIIHSLFLLNEGARTVRGEHKAVLEKATARGKPSVGFSIGDGVSDAWPIDSLTTRILELAKHQHDY